MRDQDGPPSSTHVDCERNRDGDEERRRFTESTSPCAKLEVGRKAWLDESKEADDIDCPGMICDVLGGRRLETSNIQVSLLHQVLGTNVANRTSFLGKMG